MASRCPIREEYCDKTKNIFEVILVACEVAKQEHVSSNVFAKGADKIARSVLAKMSEPSFEYDAKFDETISSFKKPLAKQKWSGFMKAFDEKDLKVAIGGSDEESAPLSVNADIFAGQDVEIED